MHFAFICVFFFFEWDKITIVQQRHTQTHKHTIWIENYNERKVNFIIGWSIHAHKLIVNNAAASATSAA